MIIDTTFEVFTSSVENYSIAIAAAVGGADANQVFLVSTGHSPRRDESPLIRSFGVTVPKHGTAKVIFGWKQLSFLLPEVQVIDIKVSCGAGEQL